MEIVLIIALVLAGFCFFLSIRAKNNFQKTQSDFKSPRKEALFFFSSAVLLSIFSSSIVTFYFIEKGRAFDMRYLIFALFIGVCFIFLSWFISAAKEAMKKMREKPM